MELLCVMTIIMILASLLVPTVLRAYSKVRGLTDEWDAPDVAWELDKEVRAYCAANTNYQFNTRADLTDKCGLAPKCRVWVTAPTTEFFPFGVADAPTNLALVFHVGPKREGRYWITKGELTITPNR